MLATMFILWVRSGLYSETFLQDPLSIFSILPILYGKFRLYLLNPEDTSKQTMLI